MNAPQGDKYLASIKGRGLAQPILSPFYNSTTRHPEEPRDAPWRIVSATKGLTVTVWVVFSKRNLWSFLFGHLIRFWKYSDHIGLKCILPLGVISPITLSVAKGDILRTSAADPSRFLRECSKPLRESFEKSRRNLEERPKDVGGWQGWLFDKSRIALEEPS